MLKFCSSHSAFLSRFFFLVLSTFTSNLAHSELGPTSSKTIPTPKQIPLDGDSVKIETAQKFYTRDYFPEQATKDGYLGVSGIIHTVEKKGTDEVFVGQRFIQVHIKGDGSCCFYAVGRSREEVIKAIVKLVDEKHTLFTRFKTDRINLLQKLRNLKNEEDLKNLKASLKQFIDNFHREFSSSSLTSEGIKSPTRHIIAEQ